MLSKKLFLKIDFQNYAKIFAQENRKQAKQGQKITVNKKRRCVTLNGELQCYCHTVNLIFLNFVYL